MTEPGRRPRRPSWSLPVSVALLVLVVAAPARGQTRPDPWELKVVAGRDTIAERSRTLRKPDDATLLAQIDWDRDGRDEYFAAWSTPLDDSRQFEHHIQVLTEESGGLLRVARKYVFRDAELLRLSVVVPPDGRDTVKVLADVSGGAKWAVRYVLESTSETPFRIPGSSHVEFADLDGDGVHEAVSWTGRPEEPRCRFGMFSVRVRPQIFVHEPGAYRSIWPRESDPWSEVMSLFVDVDHDGRPEVVALEDDGGRPAGMRRLAVYKVRASSLTTVAAATLPAPSVAFWIASDDRDRIEVLMASPQVCEQGGVPPETGLTYEFREGRLRQIR